jgi:tetratricopeptide (TPR) repeat protein
MADELKETLFDSITGNEELPDSLKDDIKEVLAQYRLETFLFLINEFGGYDWKKTLEFMLESHPNNNHENIASLINENKIQCVITTNFDCLLESALNARNIPFGLCITPDEFEKCDPHSSKMLYKFHGSVADSTGRKITDSIIGSITEVANRRIPSLSGRKIDVLKFLLENCVVIFIGYSGRDEYDIQPVIRNSNIKKIIWITHDKSIRSPQIEDFSDIKKRGQKDSIDALILLQKGSIRIKCNAPYFLALLTTNLGAKSFTPVSSSQKSEIPSKIKINDKVYIYHFIGHLCLYAGEYAKGLQAYNLALEKGKFSDNYILVDLYRGKGICCKGCGDTQSAMENLEKARDICLSEYSRLVEEEDPEEPDPSFHQRHFFKMSLISEDIGLIYFQNNDIDNALKYLEDAIQFSERLVFYDKEKLLGRNYANLGVVCLSIFLDLLDKGKFEDRVFLYARNFFQNAVDYEERTGNMIGLAKVLNSYARLELFAFGWKNAFSKGYRSFILMKELGNPFAKSEIHNAAVTVISSLCGLAETRDDVIKLFEKTQPGKGWLTSELLPVFESVIKQKASFKLGPPDGPTMELSILLKLVDESCKKMI